MKLVDDDRIKENFRKQLFLLNQEKLNHQPFTDKEFERVLRHLEGKSIFQSAKILRDKFILEREDGTQVYIQFFDMKQWRNNIFQVTNQVQIQGKYINRQAPSENLIHHSERGSHMHLIAYKISYAHIV